MTASLYVCMSVALLVAGYLASIDLHDRTWNDSAMITWIPVHVAVITPVLLLLSRATVTEKGG